MKGNIVCIVNNCRNPYELNMYILKVKIIIKIYAKGS